MTFTFFNSDKVKIFPCARRGSFTDSEQKEKIYDAESRLTTESNLTRLSGLAFNKDSYIIDTTPIAGVKNGQLWRLVIKGYYFEVETTLPRIDYFVIGLEETNSIPRTRLGILARDDQKGLGHDSAATKVDIVNVNTLESECRAICAISLDGEAGLNLDSSFCYWVSTTDTLDSLNVKYLNSSLNDKFSSLEAADEQILAEAKNYAAGLAGNYEAAGSIATSIANLKATELASIEGRLGIIEGSGEGSIAEAITKAVTEANAYADEAKANANQYSDGKANTAQANAEAEAARLDGLLRTELQAEIDSDVAAAIASEVTRSDAKAKELADAAQAAAEATAQTKVNSLANGAVKTNTEDISDINSKIATLRTEIGNLTNVMNFRGAVDAETDITDPVEGDVITIRGTGVEKVYSAGAWIEIGTASAFDAAISDIEARLTTIEDPESGSIALAKADAKVYTDECVKGCLTDLKAYSDQGKADAMTYTDDQLSTFQTTINETVAAVQSAAVTASTASSLANSLQDRFNEHETLSQGKFNDHDTLFTQQDSLIKTNKSRIDTLTIQCEQFNTELQNGTSVLTGLATRVSSIESDYLKNIDAEKNYIKKTALGDAIGIYAVAFDVSRCDTSVLEATFIQATSNPIIFIPGCTTLPKASGYAWQDAEGNQITEDSINKNLILYLTKV